LEKQGSGHSGIAGVHINGSAVLCGAKEDFSEPTVLEPASAGRVPDAAMLEIEQLVSTTVRKTLSICNRSGPRVRPS
jgi:hypothetical protein